MSNDTVPAAVADGIAAHRDAYLLSGGAQGHILLNRTGERGHALSMNLLLRFKGRKSGKIFITPLSYGRFGDEIVIVASKGGADEHPNWYLNLRERPELDFQIGGQAFRAAWRVAEGAKREAAWSYMTRCYPFYADYQASTSRLIPVVLLQPIEQIATFTAADMAGG